MCYHLPGFLGRSICGSKLYERNPIKFRPYNLIPYIKSKYRRRYGFRMVEIAADKLLNMTSPELALIVLLFGWIKLDLAGIKTEFAACPRHGKGK